MNLYCKPFKGYRPRVLEDVGGRKSVHFGCLHHFFETAELQYLQIGGGSRIFSEIKAHSEEPNVMKSQINRLPCPQWPSTAECLPYGSDPPTDAHQNRDRASCNGKIKYSTISGSASCIRRSMNIDFHSRSDYSESSILNAWMTIRIL